MNVLKLSLPNFSRWQEKILPTCASPACSPRTRLFSASRRTGGFRIGDQWYCSPECFEQATYTRLVSRCSGKAPERSTRRPRLPLGLMMLSMGHITEEQLPAALEYQRAHGGRLGEVLQALGFAGSGEVTAGVAAQWGYPVLSLKDQVLACSRKLPARLMEFYSVLPIHYSERSKKLVLGFVEQVDNHLLNCVETVLECRAVPCFITPEDFEQHYRKLRQQQGHEEVVFERAASPVENARIMRNYAVQLGAEAAKFDVCCHFVWSQFVRSGLCFDLVSRLG